MENLTRGRGFDFLFLNTGVHLFDENSRNSTLYKDTAQGAVNDVTTIFRDSRKHISVKMLGGGFKEFHSATAKFDVYNFNPDPASAVANYAFRIIQPFTQNGSDDLWMY